MRGKFLRPLKISGRRVGHVIHNAARERACQHAFRCDRPGVERQRTLQQADSFRVVGAGGRLQIRRTCPENVIHRVGIVGRPDGLPADQLQVERDGDPARDLVLQREQIARVAIESLGPQMCVRLGVDQLGSDAT